MFNGDFINPKPWNSAEPNKLAHNQRIDRCLFIDCFRQRQHIKCFGSSTITPVNALQSKVHAKSAQTKGSRYIIKRWITTTEKTPISCLVWITQYHCTAIKPNEHLYTGALFPPFRFNWKYTFVQLIFIHWCDVCVCVHFLISENFRCHKIHGLFCIGHKKDWMIIIAAVQLQFVLFAFNALRYEDGLFCYFIFVAIHNSMFNLFSVPLRYICHFLCK